VQESRQIQRSMSESAQGHQNDQHEQHYATVTAKEARVTGQSAGDVSTLKTGQTGEAYVS